MVDAISGRSSPAGYPATDDASPTHPARRARPFERDHFAAESGVTPDFGSFSGPEILPLGEPIDSSPPAADDASFDWRAYLERYPDLPAAGFVTEQDAIAHWRTFGMAEGRYAGPGESAMPSAGLSAGNASVQLGVSPRTGGAINSMVVDGREYLNDFDHGRQLQVAWQMNLGGEGNNPTEGGSGSDGVGPTTSSQVLASSSNGTGLTVVSQPAWWLRPGENVPASGAAATNGGSSSQVSDQVLTKSVEAGMTIDGVYYPNIIRHDTSITFPDGAQSVSMEMPTAYMQGDFDRHYVYDIDSGTFQPQSAIDSNNQMQTAYSQDPIGTRHRPNPFVFATADGQHAMALVPALPLPAGFDDQLLGRMSFPNANPEQATQKMSMLMTASNVPPGATLSATTYVVVGTLEEVQRALAALYS